jgi:GNAT superfamily N-acetyltransferase
VLLDHLRFGEDKRLYVDPDLRGSGIGAALVAALESAARDIGLKVVTIQPERLGHMTPERFTGFGFEPTSQAAFGRSGHRLEKRLSS